jgi:soluble lytic murein transglycosylase-like protein
MSSPISSILITPAEAAALTRAAQIEQLATRSAEGAAPSGEASFAAALEAASSAQGSGAEADPAQGSGAEAGPAPEPIPSSAPEVPGAEAEPIEILPYTGTSSSAASYAEAGGTVSRPQATASMASYTAGAAGAIPAAAPASTPGTAPTGAPSGTAAPYEALIQQAATRNGVEPALLRGLIEQESGFDPSAHSSAGALGLTQLMPSTAASLGVTEPLNPTQSIEGGARLLGELLRQFHGNVSDALAAYNAGAGAVEQYGGVPPYPETQAYVSKVLANSQSYR